MNRSTHSLPSMLFVVLVSANAVGLAENAAAPRLGPCEVTWSRPILNNSTGQYEIVIDSACNFPCQVTITNNGIEYGQYLSANQKGVRRAVGRSLGRDYEVKVEAAR